MIKKIFKNLFSIIICSFLIMSSNIFAANFSEEKNDLSITIEYENHGKKIKDVTFNIYYIAQMSDNLEFTWDEQFAFLDSILELNDLTTDDWKKISNTLSTYIDLYQLLPYDTNQTDTTGRAEFKDLKQGLYLIVGSKHVTNERMYSIMPSLVTLPNLDENRNWNGQIVIYPKYEDIGQVTSFEVIKQWVDSHNSSNRPEYIEIELLQDGTVIDVQKLSVENNWRYRWTNLETGFEYKVVEKELPAGYKVEINKIDKDSVVITNEYPNLPPPPGLEDTGVMWWPVPILFITGLLFVIIGFILARKENEYES